MPHIPRQPPGMMAPMGGPPPETRVAGQQQPRRGKPRVPVRPGRPESQPPGPARRPFYDSLSIRKHEVSPDDVFEVMFGQPMNVNGLNGVLMQPSTLRGG